jgi:hypothetical protein
MVGATSIFVFARMPLSYFVSDMRALHQIHISPSALSAVTAVCSGAWFFAVYAWSVTGSHSKDGWNETPLFWLLLLCLAPLVCAASGCLLLYERQRLGGRPTVLEWWALAAGAIPVVVAAVFLLMNLTQ